VILRERMSLFDDQPARGIGWSALEKTGLILEGSNAVYPLIRRHIVSDKIK
jgi:hypothetical protein